MKTKLSMLPFYVPIQRTEEHDDYTLVEGYAYVNARVPSDRFNLMRSAMEAATDDYMKFPAVREMHGPNAAGTGMSAEWDDKGVKLTAKIVDPVARTKVKEEVYRGFSVGVRPTVVRGNDVTVCQWNETSLVDRPADADAVFSMVRIDDSQEFEADMLPAEEEEELERLDEIERAKWTAKKRAEYPLKNFGWPQERKYPIEDQDDVDSAAKLIGKAPETMRGKIKKRIVSIAKRLKLDPPKDWIDDTDEEGEDAKMDRACDAIDVMRGAFAKMAADSIPYRMRWMALDLLGDVLWNLQSLDLDDEDDKEIEVRQAIDEFADFVVPIIVAGSWPDSDVFDELMESDRADFPTLNRLDAFVSAANEQVSTLTTERDESRTELARVQGLNETAIERVRSLETEVDNLKKMPTRIPPVLHPAAVTREWIREQDPASPEITRLRSELDEIDAKPRSSDERESGARIGRIVQIKARLRELGEAV